MPSAFIGIVENSGTTQPTLQIGCTLSATTANAYKTASRKTRNSHNAKQPHRKTITRGSGERYCSALLCLPAALILYECVCLTICRSDVIGVCLLCSVITSIYSYSTVYLKGTPSSAVIHITVGIHHFTPVRSLGGGTSTSTGIVLSMG